MKELIEILKVLDRYEYSISAEHDILLFYTYCNEELPKDVMENLEEMGVFYSSEYECLCYFV